MQVLKNSLLTEELQVELQKKTICSRLDEVDEVAGLSKLANSNHKDLLKIPLVEAFLHIKWQLIKDLFHFNVAFYATFMLMLTIMTLLLGNMSQCDNTGKSLSEALIFVSTKPQYDKELFIELKVQNMKIPSSNLGRTYCVQKLFLTFRTFFVHNMFSPKRRASDKNLPVHITLG